MRSNARIVFTAAVVAASAGLLAPPAAAVPDDVTALHAGMNGSREVPGPGSASSSGLAEITVDAGSGEICWSLQVRGIEGDIIAAHIHVGTRDVAGPVVLPLSAPVDGSSSGCATNADLAGALLADPSAYYVNVHSTVFPAGAVRGQLAGAHD